MAKSKPTKLRAEVLRSHAGFYVGTMCPQCGPYDRHSGYFATEAEAKDCLVGMSYCEPPEDTCYH